MFGGVRFCASGFGGGGEGLVGIEVGLRVGVGLVDLLDFFGCGREEVVGLGVAPAVAVDGDAALGEFLGGCGFVAADLGAGAEQQAEFADGGEALVVAGVVEVGELDEVCDELVGGEFVDEVGAEEFEVVEVGGDGGMGAAHALGDLAEGEALLPEFGGPGGFWRGGLGWGSWGRPWWRLLSCDAIRFLSSYIYSEYMSRLEVLSR